MYPERQRLIEEGLIKPEGILPRLDVHIGLPLDDEGHQWAQAELRGGKPRWNQKLINPIRE